jgi:CBS domain-containing protein
MIKIKDMSEFRDKKFVLKMNEDETVEAAVNKMVESRYGSVLVMQPDSEKVAGIVTERDFMNKVLYKKLDAKTTKLKQIMSEDVQYANENDSVTECLRRMSNGRFRHLPIVNDEGDLQGIMSQGDFVAFTWPEVWKMVKEHASITLNNKYQPLLILGSLLVYTVVILTVLSFVIG